MMRLLAMLLLACQLGCAQLPNISFEYITDGDRLPSARWNPPRKIFVAVFQIILKFALSSYFKQCTDWNLGIEFLFAARMQQQ